MKKTAAGIAAVLLFVGAFAYALHACNHHRALYEPGSVRGAVLTRSADDHSVIVLDVLVDMGDDPSRTRLDAVELGGGTSLVRVEIGEDYVSCEPAGAHRLWCSQTSGQPELHLRDVTTLDVVIPYDKLLAGAPPLAKQSELAIDANGVAWLATADGRFWGVGPDGTAAGVVDKRPESVNQGTLSTTSDLRTTRAELAFQGSPRQHIVASDRGKARPFAPGFEALGGAFLPLDVDGVLVVHGETVDYDSPRLLTALAPDGKQRWTAHLDAPRIENAWLVDGAIVLLVPDALVSIDTESGRVRWRHPT